MLIAKPTTDSDRLTLTLARSLSHSLTATDRESATALTFSGVASTFLPASPSQCGQREVERTLDRIPRRTQAREQSDFFSPHKSNSDCTWLL